MCECQLDVDSFCGHHGEVFIRSSVCSDQRKQLRSVSPSPLCISVFHWSGMEDEFGDVTFGDPAICGGYSQSMVMSEGEESDNDFQTPKQDPPTV